MTTSRPSTAHHITTSAAGRSPRAGVDVGLLGDWLRDRGGLLTAGLAGVVVLYLAWLASLQFGLPGQENTELVGDTLTFVLSAVASGLAWRAGSSGSLDVRSRRAWRILALAFGSLSLGNLLWLYFRAVLDIQPYPSLADVGYLGLYPLLLWALLSFPVAPATRAERTKIWLDTAVVVVGAGTAFWALIFLPVMQADHESWLEGALSLAYPVCDLVLVFGTATLLLRRPIGGSRRALVCLAAGLFVNALANLIYGYQLSAGSFASGGWPDALWAVATLSIAFSGQLEVWHSRRGEAAESDAPSVGRLNPLPYLAVAIGYGLLVWAVRDEWNDLIGGLVFAAVALTGLVVARQIAAHQENARLLQGQSARRSEARFRSLVQHASDLTTIVDLAGLIQYQSPSIERMAGHRAETLVHTPLADLVHPDDAPQLHAFLNEVAHQPRGRTQLEWRLGQYDGGWLYVETTATNLLGDPEVEGIVLNSRDVTERKALEDQLRRQAFHDPLTELANRALFRDRVEHALARSGRQGEVLAVLYLDLDNFKTVNDSLGHPVGDTLLVEVAARLHGCVRTSDTVARLGGDEFAILLEDATGEHIPETVAERISMVLRTPFVVDGNEVQVTASIGITDASDNRDGVDELLRNADVAMYAAKGQGKARAERFEPSMYTAVRQRLELTADLRRGLDRSEFRVFYQPIVELGNNSNQIREVEALVRWQHPERGLVPPLDFIPLAEETGLIVPLGRWVLEEACRQARAWQEQYPSEPLLVVGVNLSGRQFGDPDLVADVERVLRDTGLEPRSLKLEITESVAMQDAARAEVTMRALKDLGVQLAIDDFGTGYSSLQYLKRFPVDTLKIDKSFVDGLGANAQDTAIVQSVVALAKALHLDVTGEGIETSGQQAQLRLLGVEHGQGYLFARPLPAQEVGALLVDRNLGRGSEEAA